MADDVGLQKPRRQFRPLAFRHVTIVDVAEGRNLPDMTVLVSRGKIAEIGSTGKISLPKDAQIVEAAGRYLIPGLWDMHTHSLLFADPPEFRKYCLQLYAVNGVTGIRDMGGDWEEQVKWREAIREGREVGPRMMIAGPFVDGPAPLWSPKLFPRIPSKAVKDAVDGRQTVDAWKDRGADFLKVYSMLPRDIYLAILREARKKNLVVAGHVPIFVSAWEASRAGQKSLEHMWGVWEACSSQETELLAKQIKDYGEAIATMTPTDVSRLLWTAFADQAEASRSYDPARASRFFAELVP
jgi:imidazolonepropionase-like amidohydrolase